LFGELLRLHGYNVLGKIPLETNTWIINIALLRMGVPVASGFIYIRSYITVSAILKSEG